MPLFYIKSNATSFIVQENSNYYPSKSTLNKMFSPFLKILAKFKSQFFTC